ncbi:hypothetical protein [Pseudoalteromonas translucida]|uniref:hypothetical protein n=1 Tax=Pseudoalteromonas translucida TaxID=166935 RepID=UPI0002DDC492|nr:hypothetical protein [Pseudoalteromonas translucida]
MNKQQKIKHWQGIFEQQKSSTLTITQFCRDNTINRLLSMRGASAFLVKHPG